MHARREYDEYELITVGFKAQAHQVQIVHDAAAAKGVSTTAYLKALVLEWAASDLGLPPSAVADRVRTRKGGREPESPVRSEAAVTVARLEQAISDAMSELEALRGASAPKRRTNPPPARSVSGDRMRSVGRRDGR